MAVVAYWMFEAVVRGIIGREVVMGGFVRDHWKGVVVGISGGEVGGW